MVQERIDDMLREMGMRGSPRPAQAAPAASSGRRKGPGLDTGTVALGLTAMTYYWMMPALMSRRKRRRKPGRREPDSTQP